MTTQQNLPEGFDLTPVAANGLLDRRNFLRTGGIAASALAMAAPAAAETLAVPDWSKAPGSWLTAYGQPSKFEAKVNRGPIPKGALDGIGGGAVRTPLH